MSLYEMIELRFVKTHPDAILPEKNHKHSQTGDACYDIFSIEDVIISPKQDCVIDVGLKVGYIEPGYYLRIESRSGLGFKKKLEAHPGIIDNSYRGTFSILLFNMSGIEQKINKGQACAQFSIHRMEKSYVGWIDYEDVKNTDRGEKGFGSSDIKK